MKKRILSIVLSIVMLVGLLPTTALAADTHSSHYSCGVAGCTADHGHNILDDWTAWDGTDAKPFVGGIQLEAGNYYLTGNLTLSNTIRISGTVNLCLNGHTISNGTNSTYNVIEVSSGATLNICDCQTTAGSIISNSADTYGECIDNYHGTVNVYGGNIRTTGNIGNGIYNDYGTVNVYDGSISAASGSNYYGIYNYKGTVNVYDGSISATDGSNYGISNYSGTATVSGGTVSGSSNGIQNTSSDASLTISGSASVIGGNYGINNYNGKLQLSGAPTINGEIADISLEGSTTPTIDIVGVLTNTEKYMVTTYQKPAADSPVVFTSTVDEENAAKFESANSDYQVLYADGVLKLTVKPAHTTHPICGDTECASHGSGVAYTAWDGTGTPSGNVYLTDNVTLTESLIISSGTVNLCLNGHTITITNSQDAFYVESGATLNICDCSTNQSGKIEKTGASADYPGILNRGGTVNVYSGTVSSSNNSNGIYNYSGTVNVYSGTVSSSQRYGINNKGTVNVYGGTVSGIYSGINNKGTVNVYGGTVSSSYSNGIYNDANLNIYGGTVSGISSGINNGADGEITVSGGTVTSEGDAGTGIYNYGEVTVSGGTVKSTGADGNNYGIYCNTGTLNLSGAPTITGTTADINLEDGIITIDEDGLSNITPYAVKTGTNPTEDAKVKIVAANETDYSAKFAPVDKDSFTVVRESDNCLYLDIIHTVSVTDVTLDKNSINLYLGKTDNATLTASVEPDNATNKAVTWTTDDMAVATVDQNGVVTAVGKGYTKITATAADGSGVSDSLYVYVNDKIESVVINVVAPVVGNTINGNNFSVDASQPYYIHTTSWNGTLNNDDTNVTVEAGQNYKMKVVLAGNYGYFDDNTTASIKVGDDIIEEGVVLTASATPSTCSVEYIFNIPALEYTVTFNSNGGSAISDQTVDNGGKVEEPAAPTKTGYTFAGWYKDSELAIAWDFNADTVTEPTTLYAKWTANTNTPYVVNHWVQTLDAAINGNAEKNETNYTLNEYENLTGTTDATFKANTKEIDGFKAPDKENITIAADGSTVHNYYYTRNKYNIVINTDEGVEELSGDGQYYYEQAVEISATLKSGYKWNEWIANETGYGSANISYSFNMPATALVLSPKTTSKAEVSINTDVQNYTYDKSAKAFEIRETDLTGFTVSYEQNGIAVTPINAGFYDVILSRAEDENYKEYSETLVNGLIINKVVVDEPEVGTKLYSGSLQTAAITGTDIYEVTENNGGTNVGEYDVILTLKDTTNYKWKLAENSGATATRKFYITFTENTWEEEPQITGWTFGQELNEPTFDAKFGDVVVEYKKDSEDESEYTETVPTNAGNYNVRFTVMGNANFDGLSKVIDLSIAKAIPSLETPTAQNSITYGAKLSTVGLPTGWTWLDGTTIPTVQNSGFAAYFTPDDTENYDWTVINGWDATESRVERTVAVTVTKNNPSYTAPTGLTATYGQTLADVQLTEGWNWKAPTTSVGNAGTNTFAAVFTPVDTDNYNTVEVDLTITVARQKVAKPAENVTVFTYNSNEQIYTLTEDARYEITNNKRTDAGNQTVTIALKDSANYEWADGSVDDVEYTFTIAKATADITVDTAPIVKTYGEALTLPTATSTFGIPVCDKTVAQLSDVGSYEVTYSVAETSNYYGDTKTLSVTINPAIISKPTADNTEFVYNGSMQTYSVSSNSNYTVSGNTRTDAGEQTVTVTLTDKHNYRWDDNSTDDVTFTFTIAQKEIGIEWGTTQFTYNKTEQKPTATATGLAAGDSCTITVTGGQTNTGNGYVATAQSPSNVNYKLPAIKTTTFSIAQKSVTVTRVTIEATKVYDGEANAPITNYGTVSNVIDGDDVTVDTANASAAYNDKNVGNGKSVTFTGFAITGTDATNYVLTGQPESQSANITPKPVTITGVTVAVTKIYDANVTASIENTGSVDGVISGDAVDVNSSSVTAVYDDANVGTDKAVTFAGFAISGADALNYELSAQPASTTANITAKDIANAVITLGESLTYNGNEQPQTIASAIVDGLTITYDVSGNVNTDAGDYTLTITGNGNFEGTAQKAYTIAKADATLGTAPSAITPLTYNAAEQTLVNTGENVVGGTLMYKLSEGEYSAELPKATNAGTYTVYYKVMGDSNHNHTAEQNFTVTIAEKVVSPVVVLTAPASNQTPVTSIETDEYTATVTWSPDVTDKFAYSTDYTATVTITPKANYTLTGIRENEYTIEGAAVTNSADSSVVTAVFPKTNSRPSGGSSVTRYTVKFDTDGGSSVSSATVTKNAKVTEPKAPEKEGYTFMGWYTDEALTEAYDFDSKVTKNLTLYAKWDKHDDEQPGTDTHNCPSKAFDDLDITKWYHLDTDYVIENGIFKGTTETTFEPDSAQTRAMMVTVLYRVEGEPAVNRSIPFADVDMGAYYVNAVIWGQQNGIIKGYSETEFGPDDKITREQIAAIMHRYAQYKGYDVSVGENTNILSYDDFDSISEYAIPSMQWAVGSGLIKGKSESTLNPLDNATRAEIAAILHRFIEANK